MVDDQVTSRIDIDVRTTGVDEATRSLDKLATAENAAVLVSDKQQKARERSEAATERLAKKYDQEYRAVQQLARDQAALSRAYEAGLGGTAAYEKALAGVQKQQEMLRQTANDNKISNGLSTAAGEAARFGQALDRVQSFAWNNTNLSGNQIDRVIMPIRTLGGAIGVLPTIALTAAVGVEAALAAIGHHTQQALAELQDVARQSGLGVNQIVGAQIVGARSGLTQEQTRGAVTNAGREYESYRRNEGGVKDTLEKVDESFLKIADKARSAGEFIDIIEQKIRALPREEGLDLSKKLFGDDAGEKLFANIQSGALSMRALGDEAARAGGLNEELARHAEEVQHQIDEAAQVARTKLLVAFQDLGDPISSLQRGWWNIVGYIADAARNAGRMQEILANGEVGRAAGLHASGGTPFADVFSKYRRPGVFIGSEEYGPPLPPGAPTASAGVSRARYAARDASTSSGGASGKSDADRAAEQYAKITRELESQKALASSVGAEHDRIALEIEIERRQLELGTGATQAQKDKIAELVTQLDEAKKAQAALNEEAKKFNEAYGAVSNTASGALKDILHGGKPGDALRKALTTTQDQAFDAVLTGGGPLAKLLGVNGKDGAVGGLFGMLGGALGLGQKNVGLMNISAANVVVNGGIAGLAGLGGGGSGGGLFGGIAGLFGDLFGIGHNAGGTDNWPGGLSWVGERGPEIVNLPRGAQVVPNAEAVAYARSLGAGGGSSGGVAKIPPMTFVDQSHGVTVTPRMSDGQIMMLIENRIATNNKKQAEAPSRAA